MTFLIVLVGWIFSLCLHEFSHAFVAYRGGDYTVRDKGYLTFNPLKYTDPVYSLVVPMLFLLMGGIGLPGGAVYIERWRLRGKWWETAVSLAGPAANALLAVLLGILLGSTAIAGSFAGPGLACLALLQVTAVVLNLIPLPPFDGFGALEPHLEMAVRLRLAAVRGTLGLLVIVVMWWVPFVRDLFWNLVFVLSLVVGVPLQLAGLGLDQFMFWR
jgi:Zn-dependent protease